MDAHHKHGGSSAKKWMTCPLSAVLEPLEPEREASAYMLEGTAVHEVARACVANRVLAWGYLGAIVEGVELTEDHVTSINDYVTLIDELAGECEGAVFVERRVNYGEAIGYEGAFGTLDCGIVSADGKHVTIIDRKFKWGYRVYAERNPQLMLYALGMRAEVLELYGEAPECYTLVIHQHLEGAASTWECSDADLLAFAEEAKLALARCEQARCDAESYPMEQLVAEYGHPSTDACRYCKARATCPALAQRVLGAVSGVDVDLTQDVGELHQGIIANREALAASGMEQLAKYALLTELVRLWCNAVDARLNSELGEGTAVPGWKLVQGRKGNRKFIDEEETKATFRGWGFEDTETHNLKLKTPAQLEKLVKNDRKKYPVFQTLTIQEEGKPKAAPEADPRPAIEPIIFESVDEEL